MAVTKEELVNQVRMLAEELGRTPTKMDFEMDWRVASPETARRQFGSWNKFLETAGLKANQQHRERIYATNDEMIAQVKMMAKELGRTPTRLEFDRSSKTSSASAIVKRFGSWSNFLEAAGLELNVKR